MSGGSVSEIACSEKVDKTVALCPSVLCYARDILVLLIITTVLTGILSMSSTLVWVALFMGGIAVSYKLSHGGTWDARYIQWFAIAKFVGALLGVIALNSIREISKYDHTAHLLLTALLAINIVEAIIRDLELKHTTNAVVGAILICTLPYYIGVSTLRDMQEIMNSTGLSVYSLHISWVLLYSTWNAAFAYGDNYSLIIRLILIPPIFLSIVLGVPEVWLSARCFSLMSNMICRVTHAFYVYTPGQSPLTPPIGTIKHDSYFASIWGCVNLVCALIMILYLFV
jgi:hypothetical protein